MTIPSPYPHIRLVAIDLDGTLLTSTGKLPLRGSQAIRLAHAKGARIVIATTRNEHFVRKICAELAIDDPFICANGAMIYSEPGGTLWKQSCLPVKIARRICQEADEQGWELSTSIGVRTYVRQRPGQTLGRFSDHIEVVKTNLDALSGPPHRILAWLPEAITQLERICRTEFPLDCRTELFYHPNGNVHSLGIFALGADKGTALRFVLEKMAIDPRQVLAIGDNANDLPMFAVAAVSVAMGNSPIVIQQTATDVAPSNDEEGVAWVLAKYVLEG